MTKPQVKYNGELWDEKEKKGKLVYIRHPKTGEVRGVREKDIERPAQNGSGKVSPLRQQYLNIKQQYPDCILFFRLGDFYETFDGDAEIIARELDLVLTGRPISKTERIPMAGVPYHALESYIARLIDKGYHVAVCEQITTADTRVGSLNERAVTKVITPGSVREIEPQSVVLPAEPAEPTWSPAPRQWDDKRKELIPHLGPAIRPKAELVKREDAAPAAAETIVVNFRDVKDHWNKETQMWDDPRYVYIGRYNPAYRLPKSKWANPFKVGDGHELSPIERYRALIESNELAEHVEELRGKVLVCWCKPEACHGDVLLELLNVQPVAEAGQLRLF